MCERVYFDTNVFRAMGVTFETETLPHELRDRILISPLSVYEVWSQLTVKAGDDVLRQVRAVTNWTNVQRTGLLPWPDDMLAQLWFGKPVEDDGFTKRMEKAFNVCLAAESIESLQEEAGHLKDFMDDAKRRSAEDFGRLVEAARKAPCDFSEAWFIGIANRIGADPKSRASAEITAALSAYHEFEEVKLQTALQNEDYNPMKHQNDLLDAEQLVYLFDPSLCFVTSDTGFRRITSSPQQARIVITSPAVMGSPQDVEALLRRFTTLPTRGRDS